VWQTTKFKLEACPLPQMENLNWDTFDLVINTTSVGLHDSVTLVPERLLRRKMFVYDLVYKPGDTILIQQAAARGCNVLNGLSLLLYQGADSFRLWFETEPPLEVMRQALIETTKGD
jgi:shikimate dehydrogenase